jgi:hypothetical protein
MFPAYDRLLAAAGQAGAAGQVLTARRGGAYFGYVRGLIESNIG